MPFDLPLILASVAPLIKGAMRPDWRNMFTFARNMAPSAAFFFLSACVANGEAPTWDWQLQGPYDLSVDVDVIDLDPDEVTAAQVAALNERGVGTIAYVSVGTLENWRNDKGAFPDRVVGNTYGDWPDEKFLDIRDLDALLPLMEQRFQTAADMGLTAIEPDNMDVYINESGFDISADDTVLYITSLADIAHDLGLEMGQKNVPELTPQLVDILDFMVAEACYADGWCDDTLLYIEAGKPVFDVEYTDTNVDWAAACSYAQSVGISMILHDRDLAGPAIETC